MFIFIDMLGTHQSKHRVLVLKRNCGVKQMLDTIKAPIPSGVNYGNISTETNPISFISRLETLVAGGVVGRTIGLIVHHRSQRMVEKFKRTKLL